MIKTYGSTDNKNIHTDTSNTLLEYKQDNKWYKYKYLIEVLNLLN